MSSLGQDKVPGAGQCPWGRPDPHVRGTGRCTSMHQTVSKGPWLHPSSHVDPRPLPRDWHPAHHLQPQPKPQRGQQWCLEVLSSPEPWPAPLMGHRHQPQVPDWVGRELPPNIPLAAPTSHSLWDLSHVFRKPIRAVQDTVQKITAALLEACSLWPRSGEIFAS